MIFHPNIVHGIDTICLHFGVKAVGKPIQWKLYLYIVKKY